MRTLLLIFCFSFLPLFAIEEKRMMPQDPALILAVSMPKSGTHLLARVITLLTGKESMWGTTHTIIDQAKIQKFGASRFYISHAPCTKENKEIVLRNRMKIIFILRDPRDVLVSYAYWAKKDRSANIVAHWPYRDHPYGNAQAMASWSINDFISHFIAQYPFKGPRMPLYTTIVDFYKLYLPWQNRADCYVTTFEKLVGPQGGGDKKIQEEEIMNIAHFLGLKLTQEHVSRLTTKIFGGTGTFREGHRGSWKKTMTIEQKKSLYEMEGFNQLLIDLNYEINTTWE